MVLLHGLAVSHRHLMPIARPLADRYPVLGTGPAGLRIERQTPHRLRRRTPCGAPFRLAGHPRDYPDLPGRPPFGAEIAARLAVIRPDLISALVLVSRSTDPSARSRRGLIRRWTADLFVEAPWQAAVLARDIADAKPWRVLATIGPSVRNPVEQDLQRLPVAPLVLGGELDPVAPPRWRASVATMTGGTCATIPGAAHNVLTTSGRRSAAANDAHVRRCTG